MVESIKYYSDGSIDSLKALNSAAQTGAENITKKIGETGFEPVATNSQSIDNKEVISKAKSGTAKNLPFSPDLQAIIELWDSLPDSDKKQILSIVNKT